MDGNRLVTPTCRISQFLIALRRETCLPATKKIRKKSKVEEIDGFATVNTLALMNDSQL